MKAIAKIAFEPPATAPAVVAFSRNSPQRARRVVVAAVVLLVVLAGQMVLCISRQSQTFDEADHIFAGYRYWRCSDFGANPEHPPLAKLLASFPLLLSKLRTPSVLCSTGYPSSEQDFRAGREFLYSNDANSIIFQSRVCAGLLTLTLALLLFEAGFVMFGPLAGLLALFICVFDPNLLAHGTLVHTDLAVSCFLFAAVYSFYRYLQAPSLLRLLQAGVIAGMALASKLSGLLVFPLLAILALFEVATSDFAARRLPERFRRDVGNAVKHALALLLVAATATIVLWGFYGFRFSARLSADPLQPAITAAMPTRTGIIAAIARWHLLPEAFLYGLRYQLGEAGVGRPTFMLGKLYPHGQWFYFPFVILVKSTLGFLLLLGFGLMARRLYRREKLRELLFLVLPPLLLMLVSLISKNDLGMRYILPIYAFLILLAGAAAAALWQQHRLWKYVIGLLLAAHALSSLRSFPNYLAYSNELWGGPKHTYRVLTDSNADWGQGLKATAEYLRQAGITDCWFAYPGTADPRYYGIKCRLLDAWPAPDAVPQHVRGTVLVSTSELSGLFSGPPDFNPYAQFSHLTPVANIQGTTLVFQGTYDVTLASAIADEKRALMLADQNRGEEAVAEARSAVALAPRNPSIRLGLAQVLSRQGHSSDAQLEYRKALLLAETVHPDFNGPLRLAIRKQLRE